MATLVDKFLQNTRKGTVIDRGHFSQCFENSATTVITRTSGIHNGFVKLLTGITLNAYFDKHYGKKYLHSVRIIGTEEQYKYYEFLVTKLDTYSEHTEINSYDTCDYEKYFQLHELGTLYKSYFYPYSYRARQDNIGKIWLDAKRANCGYYKGNLILFDSIPSVDTIKATHTEFYNLLSKYNIPYTEY